MDSHKRTIVKTMTWRVVATTVTMLVSYVWLGEWGSAVALAITANAIKSLLYYLHERGWNRVGFGIRKEAKEDYTI